MSLLDKLRPCRRIESRQSLLLLNQMWSQNIYQIVSFSSVRPLTQWPLVVTNNRTVSPRLIERLNKSSSFHADSKVHNTPFLAVAVL